MSLRYALLAILRVGPLSGYDLQKQFSQSVGHVWHAPDSQIYPELRKMQNEGLIEGEEQRRGERGMRRVYHVTEAGDRAYREWMATPLDYQRVRDPAHLRAAYLENTTPEAARDFLHGHIAYWESELEAFQGELDHIERMDSAMLNRRLEVTPDGEREATIEYKRFAYEGLAERARGEIDWARRGLKLVDRLASRVDAAAGI
ncbi:PadR family transcriptional regulator [Microbacterium horticulturae]|uniref:PadR family transcriptional regulator n=1 Tax=Microbacterium horticulturae TaxID=3028316 RepID=A0ABY8BW91_9MICO|nr:PadR family transcriptional regulator [Microbacterium sp. KACC 23027]WEG08453.1 PadR family transcriptional regulator [Microbacterium sp. KACC 23027]